MHNFIFDMELSQPTDWMVLIHLSPSLKPPEITLLYLDTSPTNSDKRLNGYLRSHNNALTATHLHHFINFYLLFFLLVIHIENKCRFSAIRRIFDRIFKPSSFSQPKRLSFNYNFLLILSLTKIWQLFLEKT